MMLYAPYLTTLAGACLTQTNWQELDIRYAVCGFAQIVVKPGLDFWQLNTDLKTYLAWEGRLILDARELQLNERKSYVIRSVYDGSRVVLSIKEYQDLVKRLNPDVFLPPEREPDVNQFFTVPAWNYAEKDGFLVHDHLHAVFVSDKPAQDALQGKVYQTDTVISLFDPIYTQDFAVIDPQCICPSCKQGLTRAYFHHLLQSTPLLCQRFLLMHNVFALNTLLKTTEPRA